MPLQNFQQVGGQLSTLRVSLIVYLTISSVSYDPMQAQTSQKRAYKGLPIDGGRVCDKPGTVETLGGEE
jgi:hypothetical protein